mgnify:CR=1 FL=1
MTRAIAGTLLTAQTATARKPFIKMLFTSKDGLTTRDLSTNSVAYGNRILFIDHVEEAYNEYAVVVLRNSDKLLPAIKGYWTEIGYGDITATGNEYAGDGVNGGARACSRLWVKSQQTISAGGKLYTILELEGMWAQMGETLIIKGTAPLYNDSPFTANTIYSILENIIETQLGWVLEAIGTQSDSIIDVLTPDFVLNEGEFEVASGIVYRLLRMTKCLLRPKPTLTFEVRYPLAADVVDLTFNSNSAPFFYKFTYRDIVHVPSRVIVYGNAGTDLKWTSSINGNVNDADSLAAYADLRGIWLAPNVTVQGNVDLLAAAVLSKIKAESVVGIGEVPHHCKIELLDKVAFVDNRVSANTYPADGTVRVNGLRHTVKSGQYRLQITLGGVSTTRDIARSVGLQTIVFNDIEEKAVANLPPEVRLEAVAPGLWQAPVGWQPPQPVAEMRPATPEDIRQAEILNRLGVANLPPAPNPLQALWNRIRDVTRRR